MRKPHTILLTALLWMAPSAGATEPAVENTKAVSAPETSESIPLPPQGKISGKVTQTMDVSEYTYIEIDTGNGLICLHHSSVVTEEREFGERSG
ncbi:MAG: hypothetical protein JRE38_10315 [Deltaproteobacteria bacterium]|nr:hypothetical protein [Deltaproteobacteria bacterium]